MLLQSTQRPACLIDHIMPNYTLYGWYTSTVIPGRTTPVAPPDASTTTTPGQPRANWDGRAWVMQPYVTEPDNTAAIAAAAKAAVLADKWTAIKIERDRRQKIGVKVGADWFHSDADSRTQQLGMVVAGANLPVGMQWKTLTRTGSVFVTMTPSLAGSIFQAVMASDSAIFSAAEKHRKALEASTTPETYNVLTGWPVSFEDAA